MQPFIVISLAAVVFLVLTAWARNFVVRERNLQRLFASPLEPDAGPVDAASEPRGLRRWLHLAGSRSRGATATFLLAMLVLTAVGFAMAYGISLLGLVRMADAGISQVPGGMADILRPFLYLGPWIICLALALLPLLWVRRARRTRVSQVEQDLPVTLELLATLAEAGLGFDAGLSRILDAQPSRRPLAGEFRLFQTDVLAGRPRIESLRRVARRLDVAAVTIFISALVQAEQIGSGVAAVLRSQADDLRQRRRERALELSMTLPVKRMFPMVICFLPGIMLFALGPTFNEFFKYADTIIRTHRL